MQHDVKLNGPSGEHCCQARFAHSAAITCDYAVKLR